MDFLVTKMLPGLLIMAGIIGGAVILVYNYNICQNASIGLFGGVALLASLGYVAAGIMGMALWWGND